MWINDGQRVVAVLGAEQEAEPDLCRKAFPSAQLGHTLLNPLQSEQGGTPLRMGLSLGAV